MIYLSALDEQKTSNPVPDPDKVSKSLPAEQPSSNLSHILIAPPAALQLSG